MRGVSESKAGSSSLSEAQYIVAFILERVLLLLTKLRTAGVRNEFEKQVPNITNDTENDSNDPMLPGESVLGYFQGLTSEFDHNDLASNDEQPDSDKDLAVKYSSEDVLLIIDLSCVEHVEDLNDDKDVEHIGKVSTRSELFVLGFIQRSVVPVELSSWVDEAASLSSLESPERIRLRIDVLASKDNNVHDYDLIYSHTNNVFEHLSGDDVFVLPVGRSVKKFRSGRFSS